MRERELIEWLRARAAPGDDQLGIGDDCCIWQGRGQQCLSVDSLVEGRHFTGDCAPGLVGRKAAAAALSDLAAMGAVPTGAAVALHCPARWDAMAVMEGLLAELQRHDCPLLGGDTCGSDQLVIAVTVWGSLPPDGRFLRRDTAAAGDLLVVTGALGGSLASGRHLRPEPRLAEGRWLAQREFVHAMIDCSDGLASDLRRICEASGLGAMLLGDRVPVHEDVPPGGDPLRRACCDGEDFELLFAIEASAWPTLVSLWPFAVPLSEVGWMLPDPPLLLEDGFGRVAPLEWSGYEHGD
jgi:thiamine-monophosphate kinase